MQLHNELDVSTITSHRREGPQKKGNEHNKLFQLVSLMVYFCLGDRDFEEVTEQNKVHRAGE